MWKKTLTLWKITLLENPRFTLFAILTYFFLNFLFLVPLLNVFNFFVESVVTFGLLICVSNLYLSVKGEVQAYRESMRTLNTFQCMKENLAKAIAVSLAHMVMGVIALLFVLLGLIIIALITGVSYFIFSTIPPPEVLTPYLVFLVFVYFAIVTSYPAFFARVVFEAKNAVDYFFMFITAPFSKLLLKMSLSLDLLISSLIIASVSLLLALFKLFVMWLLPLSIIFVSFFAFLNALLIYLFGVVVVGEFVWKKER